MIFNEGSKQKTTKTIAACAYPARVRGQKRLENMAFTA
jgi:hypothetical protein